jgi:glycosyltransferase involved in cell wall biosynthesis/Tfp pilus assembly protein PilF
MAGVRHSRLRGQSQKRHFGDLMGQANSLHEIEISVEPIAPARWPSISVCMIVKNEAANIGPCLSSLEDLAAEIVVVDTGSTDETVQIARSYGARVYHFAWIDDFAAARNVSLAQATGEWILILDADDRLDHRSVAQWKRAAASGLADAYASLVESRTWYGGRETTENVRLFRNGLGIKYTGALHESVVPALACLGACLAHTNIVIQHTGYLESFEAIRQKQARNLAIVERELAKWPERLDLIYARGMAYSILGELGRAEADLRSYLARTEPSNRSRFGYSRFWAYAALLNVLERQADWQGLEELLLQALAEFPDHPHFMAMLGDLCRRRGRLQEALMHLHKAYDALAGTVRGSAPSRAQVALIVAQCYGALAQFPEAVHWAMEARALDRNLRAASIFLARLYLERGELLQAEEELAPLVANGDLMEPWLLLAELRSRQGRWSEAAAAIKEAQARGLAASQAEELLARLCGAHILARTSTSPGLTVQEATVRIRGLALLSKGEHLSAAELFAEAIEAAPDDPDNYRYLAVALQRLGHTEEAAKAWALAEHWQACKSAR